jgi:hypothetical protein
VASSLGDGLAQSKAERGISGSLGVGENLKVRGISATIWNDALRLNPTITVNAPIGKY